jgi:FAD/FMN-containing dehydrogenase
MRFDFKNDTVLVNQNVLVSDLIKFTLLRSNTKFIFPVQPASALKLPVRVGGLIASNASGITSGKLGSVEDWIKTIRVMTPNGDVAEVDRNDPICLNIIGGNGYFGVILSAVFRLYRPETNLKQAILYGYNLNLAFKGLQSVLDSKIFPLISEFVISDENLPGKFSELGREKNKNKKVKWAAIIEGSKNNVDKFIDIMKQQADCFWKILTEEEFQDYLQERSSFALLVQTEDKTTDYIAFPGFEDILSEPKNLPDIIETINALFIKHGFHKVIFGYGHINFRKGQGLLLHMRLPVPIPYFYKENENNLKLICETVFDVIINLKNKFNIKHKAEHSPGPFKIWLEPKFRNLLRKETKNGDVFPNPHLMIFDELLLRKFKVSLDGLQNIDEQLPMSEKKDLFVSAMILYLSGE